MTTESLTKTKPTTQASRVRIASGRRFQQSQRAANLFKQVSDPSRLRVITMLSAGERNVGGMCEELGISQPAGSHHLALLRHGGIIESRRQGKNNFYSLTDTGEQLARMIQDVIV
jgi:DNA-binding transcriptional ArsR family regulator